MTKTLLYRIFGAGKIPQTLLQELKPEGILFLDEGIKGSVTYQNFRSPLRYSKWKRQWYTASVVITEHRFLALRFKKTIINIPLEDESIRKTKFSLEKDETLLLVLESENFNKDWSGKIEYRFHTQQAKLLLNKINKASVK